MEFEIRVGNHKFSFFGYGDRQLTLTDPHEIVLRKSNFASARTLAVKCNVAAIDMPREMIKALQNPKMEGVMEIVGVDDYLQDSIPTLEFS